MCILRQKMKKKDIVGLSLYLLLLQDPIYYLGKFSNKNLQNSTGKALGLSDIGCNWWWIF